MQSAYNVLASAKIPIQNLTKRLIYLLSHEISKYPSNDLITCFFYMQSGDFSWRPAFGKVAAILWDFPNKVSKLVCMNDGHFTVARHQLLNIPIREIGSVMCRYCVYCLGSNKDDSTMYQWSLSFELLKQS